MSTAPRTIALELLLKAEAAGQYANIALDTALSRHAELTGADRALCTALFYGVIERRITLDHVIDGLSGIAPSSIEARVRMILRMALCQLCFFDRIPDHAAINEAVEQTPRRSKGFVNAILRRFCREGKQISYPDADREPTRYLSVRYSVAPALAERFLQDFGMARADALLAAFEKTPEITVRVNTNRYTREEWIAQYGGTPTTLAPFGVSLPNGERLAEILKAGDAFVQDEASQICVAALDVQEGMRVLDLCAAPGSKSFGAALSGAAEVMSFDLHENKISLIRKGAKGLGLSNIKVGAADARRADPAVLGCFERVICDVPCSGYGVLAKKPDIRYKDPDGLEQLRATQAAILDRAAALVASGGVLVYSTCTLLPDENEEQVKVFLANHSEFTLSPFSVGELQSDGMLTLAPDTHGTDGFFVAKLQKTV